MTLIIVANEFEKLLKGEKQMNIINRVRLPKKKKSIRTRKMCASPNMPGRWEDINLKAARKHVKKLQMRIAKAQN